MDKNAYLQEIINVLGFVDVVKDISKTTNNPSNTEYISNLMKDFIDFDKVKTNFCAYMSSVDTIIVNDDLFLIEFKRKDISRMKRQALQEFLRPVKLKMIESLLVIIESYKNSVTDINLYDLLNSFNEVKMRLVLKQRSINPNNRTRLRNYGIELGRILGTNNIDFLLVTGNEFDSQMTNFNLHTQTT